MPKISIPPSFRAGVIGTIGLFAGFLSYMDPLAIRSLQAADASSAATATATSSSSSSSGGCHSESRSSAQATIVVDGERKTVRREDADRSDDCGGRADSEARAVIDGSTSKDGEAGQ